MKCTVAKVTGWVVGTAALLGGAEGMAQVMLVPAIVHAGSECIVDASGNGHAIGNDGGSLYSQADSVICPLSFGPDSQPISTLRSVRLTLHEAHFDVDVAARVCTRRLSPNGPTACGPWVYTTGGGAMRPPQTIEAIAPVGVTNDSTKAWLEIEYDGTRDLLIHGYVQTK